MSIEPQHTAWSWDLKWLMPREVGHQSHKPLGWEAEVCRHRSRSFTVMEAGSP